MCCSCGSEVETNLRCSKCGKPICPRCMMQTPVGARCPDCAKLYKLPTYRVSAKYYLRAIGVALGMAIIGGIVWRVVGIFLSFFLFNFLLAAGVGYAIGEMVSLSVNRKRGTWLATVAGTAVIISYLVNILIAVITSYLGGIPFGLFPILLAILALALGIFAAVTRLR